MRKSVLGLAVVALTAAAVQADVTISTTLTDNGTYSVAGSGTLTATPLGGDAIRLENVGGTNAGVGFSYGVYTLATPVPISWVKGLTATINQISGGGYTPSPTVVIDADGTGGINATTDVAAWFYTHTPADLGNDGTDAGDSFISADAFTGGGAVGAGPINQTIIGNPNVVQGWFGSDADQVNFALYRPWTGPSDGNPLNDPDSIILGLNAGGYGGTQADDMLYQIIFLNGGSTSFANNIAEISNVVVTIPEPASLGLLGLGGLLMLKRRRTA